VAQARERWRQDQPSLDPTRLVFLDETGTSTNMVRTRGRSRRGTRLIGRVPHGHWKITTFIAGLRSDQIAAPFVIDRPMNSAIFLAYIERCLIPTLKPGDIVVMDNLKPHKAKGVREALEAANAKLLYLPPPAFAGAGSTLPISTLSNSPSPSSRHCCEKPPNDRSTPCGTASAASSTTSPHRSAPHTCATTVTVQLERNPL
jgi:hypothetical protein